MTEPKKRGRGRPRAHADTKMVAFRASLKAANAIMGSISTIRLVSQERDTPIAMVVMDALKARLKALTNVDRDNVERALRVLDRALDSYQHVKR